MRKTVKRIKARSKNPARKGKGSRKGVGKSKGPASSTAAAFRSDKNSPRSTDTTRRKNCKLPEFARITTR